MTKITPNPFDSFTIEHTPDDFWECAWHAIDWLMPHFNEQDIVHQTFVAYCKSYSDRIFNNPKQSDDPITEEEYEFLISRQRLIVATFNRIRDEIVLDQATVSALSHSKAQSERASKLRKVTEAECQRIAKQYWQAKADGTAYGVVKRLAGQYNLSQTSVQTIVKKYKQE